MRKRSCISSVDEFVKSKVLPEFREIVELIRAYMRELAPGVQELISYGIPAYKGKRILAVISPTKKDITFSFSRGRSSRINSACSKVSAKVQSTSSSKKSAM